jgi:hypothetical protein
MAWSDKALELSFAGVGIPLDAARRNAVGSNPDGWSAPVAANRCPYCRQWHHEHAAAGEKIQVWSASDAVRLFQLALGSERDARGPPDMSGKPRQFCTGDIIGKLSTVFLWRGRSTSDYGPGQQCSWRRARSRSAFVFCNSHWDQRNGSLSNQTPPSRHGGVWFNRLIAAGVRPAGDQKLWIMPAPKPARSTPAPVGL